MSKRKLIRMRHELETELDTCVDVPRAELLRRQIEEVQCRLDEMGGDEVSS